MQLIEIDKSLLNCTASLPSYTVGRAGCTKQRTLQAGSVFRILCKLEILCKGQSLTWRKVEPHTRVPASVLGAFAVLLSCQSSSSGHKLLYI